MPPTARTSAPQAYPKGTAVISFESVSKVYPDGTHAVEDLTLEIPTGKITVFVGPSGCGKTTSLRMINRMIEPTGGAVLIDGQDTRSIDAPTPAPGHRLRHPERRAVPAPHGAGQRRHRAGPAGPEPPGGPGGRR